MGAWKEQPSRAGMELQALEPGAALDGLRAAARRAAAAHHRGIRGGDRRGSRCRADGGAPT
uniref:Uncharacterized protein n=1 Tax=Arundo donax TaxID=35708 RepID=A0A0A9T2F8_ARUDO